MSIKIPKNYSSEMNIKATEKAIKQIKDFFEKTLAEKLNLTRVSAPLFVVSKTGLNDNLNGTERPVSFDVIDMHEEVEIVHSLAKWKRMALKKYSFNINEGLYTDMDAIRRDETLDNIHSVYVDQWDWEKIILKDDRHIETLKETVKLIFSVFKEAEQYITDLYPSNPRFLPEEIYFITTQELEDMYPDKTPKQREDAICRKYKAVFVSQIGKDLKSGVYHDGRAPDYDDWELNGDILFWYPPLESALEVSSMGIRVDENSLVKQLEKRNCSERLQFEYHRNILEKVYPYTIGGGIGQSRLCMFFLGKAHIGEVQASVWPEEMISLCETHGIRLL